MDVMTRLRIRVVAGWFRTFLAAVGRCGASVVPDAFGGLQLEGIEPDELWNDIQ